jgi:hypothetical protein
MMLICRMIWRNGPAAPKGRDSVGTGAPRLAVATCSCPGTRIGAGSRGRAGRCFRFCPVERKSYLKSLDAAHASFWRPGKMWEAWPDALLNSGAVPQ